MKTLFFVNPAGLDVIISAKQSTKEWCMQELGIFLKKSEHD